MLGGGNWFYFPFDAFSAKENMAIDHYFASNFKNYKQVILRFYRWKPYCISLGYHQKNDILLQDKISQDGYDIIRRPTGGRAVFHSNELSYAIICPKNSISKIDLYHKTHHAFSSALNTLGLKSELNEKKNDLTTFSDTRDTFSCFASNAQYEVKEKTKKLIGSAQRIYPNAILQHGSIMLGDEHLKLLNYLNITENERHFFRNELRKSSTFIELKHFSISLTDLIQYFYKSFKSTFHFKSLVEIQLKLDELKYEL